MDEIDFVAEHPKKDMSKVNRVVINGKVYLAADKVLEIIDEIEHDIGHVALIGDDNKFIGVLCNSREFRDVVLALKGGEQE